jgi:hypothetical protein
LKTVSKKRNIDGFKKNLRQIYGRFGQNRLILFYFRWFNKNRLESKFQTVRTKISGMVNF